MIDAHTVFAVIWFLIGALVGGVFSAHAMLWHIKRRAKYYADKFEKEA